MGRILILGSKGERIEQQRKNVQSFGHNVITVDFDLAAEYLYNKKPDLVLVDLTNRRGILESWHAIRSDIEDSHTAAIVIVPEDRVRDIELFKGIRDFILYPYDLRELEMRIKLILVKQQPLTQGEIIKVGNITIDSTKYEVTVDGWPVILTLKEYELLKYLATHQGRVLTREILLDQIWGYDYYGGTRTVDVHIGRLRTKIETEDYSFIKTVRGVGYIFSDEYSLSQVITT